VARAWDGEGHTEWLTTESPCFGIVHDHPSPAARRTLRRPNGPWITPSPMACEPATWCCGVR
jgi:hypothetical protein